MTEPDSIPARCYHSSKLTRLICCFMTWSSLQQESQRTAPSSPHHPPSSIQSGIPTALIVTLVVPGSTVITSTNGLTTPFTEISSSLNDDAFSADMEFEVAHQQACHSAHCDLSSQIPCVITALSFHFQVLWSVSSLSLLSFRDPCSLFIPFLSYRWSNLMMTPTVTMLNQCHDQE
jgi:hypothetical protein